MFIYQPHLGSGTWSLWTWPEGRWRPASFPWACRARLQESPTLKKRASWPGPSPHLLSVPHPWHWHQAERINVLKATPGIIKMTNWRIETIYAFVYLKILPLFIETRKMGTVWQREPGKAAAAGPAPAAKPGGWTGAHSRESLSICSWRNFTSTSSTDRRECFLAPQRPACAGL